MLPPNKEGVAIPPPHLAAAGLSTGSGISPASATPPQWGRNYAVYREGAFTATCLLAAEHSDTVPGRFGG